MFIYKNLSVETTKYLINTKFYIQTFERRNNKISNQYKFLYTRTNI